MKIMRGTGETLRAIQSIVFVSILAFSSSAFALDPAFRAWTDRVFGENVRGGFESHCPKEPRAPSDDTNYQGYCDHTTHQRATLGVSNLKSVGLVADTADEWVWIKEAMKSKQKGMLRNYRHLGLLKRALSEQAFLKANPGYQKEIDATEQNLEIIGSIEREIRAIDVSETTGHIPCTLGDSECNAGFAKQVDENKKRKEELFAAEQSLVERTPLLAHSAFSRWIQPAKIGVDTPYDPKTDRKQFLDALKTAIGDAQDTIVKKNGEYTDLMNHEERLADLIQSDSDDAAHRIMVAGPGGAVSVSNGKEHHQQEYHQLITGTTQDVDLIEDLLMSEDPTDVPGLANLRYASCSLSNRVLKDKAVGELRHFAFESTLLLGGAAAGLYLEGGTEAGEAVGTAESAEASADLSPVLFQVATSIGPAAANVKNVSKRCDEIASTIASETNLGARKLRTKAYYECKEELNDAYVESLLSVATASPDLKTSLLDRVKDEESEVNKALEAASDVIENADEVGSALKDYSESRKKDDE